jgi:hypothetical protein
MLLRGGGSRRRILVERGLREEVPSHGPRAACGNKRNGMRACPMVRCIHVGDDGRRYRDDGLDIVHGTSVCGMIVGRSPSLG